MHFSFVHCHLNYANIAWSSPYKNKLEGLYRHQKHAALIINFEDRFIYAQPPLHDMKSQNIFQINLFLIIYFMFKCKKKIACPIFHSLFLPKPENKCNIRSRGKLTEPFYGKKNVPSSNWLSWSTFMEWTRSWEFSFTKFTAIIPQEN